MSVTVASAELLRTPLAQVHEALGARMTPFSGWLMPLQYDGIIAEHLHTRTAAGLFDLSHMGRLAIDGAGATALLQRATTNDLNRLSNGSAQYSLMCNERGGVIEDLLVYRIGESLRLVVNAGNRERVIAHLNDIRIRQGYEARVRDDTTLYALLGLQGPEAEAVLQTVVTGELATLGYYRARVEALQLPSARASAQAARESTLADEASPLVPVEEEPPVSLRMDRIPCVVSRTGYTGEDGFEIMVAAVDVVAVWKRLLADARVKPVGLGARDTLRLEAGMALYGHELTEDVDPHEAGLDRVVRLDKGDFVGRGALLASYATQPSRRLIGLELDGRAVPRSGLDVWRQEEKVGFVASGTFSPTLRRPIATAYVKSDACAVGTELEVTIRAARAQAHVVSLPFVAHHMKRLQAQARP